MPATYNYSTRSTTISCTRCDTAVIAEGYRPHFLTADTFDTNGNLVNDTFQWHSGTGRFYSMCRTCANEARRQSATNRRMRRAQAATSTPSSPTTPSRSRLGIERQFGVELELLVPDSVGGRGGLNLLLHGAGLTRWTVKTDCSLRPPSGFQGWEIVSPPLHGDEGMEQIRTACRVLNRAGVTVNQSCGLHVHHDINDMTVEEIKRAAVTFNQNQPLIDGLVAASRRGRQTYCGGFSSEEMVAIDRCTGLSDIRGLEHRITRYRNFNLTAFGRYGTVEIRQHQGTSNFEKIRTWILFAQSILDSAIEVETSVPAVSGIRNLITCLGDRLDETAATFMIGRTIQLAHASI